MRPQFSLNPLFEREWRGRFRRPATHLQLALLVLVLMALVCLGVWRLGLLPAMYLIPWRQNGHALLNTYRWAGALIFWGGGLLLGATSVSDEKTSATWEHLLLSPAGGPGLSVGKIMSSAAWLVILQLVLFPPLLIAGFCFGATPPEIAGVMLAHLLLTIQAAVLGFWGALRGQDLVSGIGQSLQAIVVLLAQCLLVASLLSCVLVLFGAVLRGILLIPIPGLSAFFTAAWPVVLAFLMFVAKILASLVAGITGIGVPLQSWSETGRYLFAYPLFVGQLMGSALFLKWSAWELDHPTRDFWASTPIGLEGQPAHQNVIVRYRVWSWTLTTEQLRSFPVRESREPLRPNRSLLPTWEKAMADVTTYLTHPAGTFVTENVASPQATEKAPRANTKRMRAPVSRRWQELNPVLWLDLTRCLSLRSPDSAMLPFLLILGALGGSILLAISLFLLVGWIQNAFGGARGDVSSLSSAWNQLHWVLWWAALSCGPLWGTMGYVVERRTGMLVELRLTLITALEMWVGKFGARFGIFAALSVPLLAIVAFFAWNWPTKSAVSEVTSAFLSSWSLGVWSVCACLWLSDSCRRDLTAALWCVTFGVGWGLLLWSFPTFNWAPVHLLGAALAGGHIFWRLKRLGFG